MLGMKAEIIAVGSELLTPDRIDTNSLFLTEELNKLGIEVLRKTIVGDNRELLAEAFRDALNRVPVVIASGGLGPTALKCSKILVEPHPVCGSKIRAAALPSSPDRRASSSRSFSSRFALGSSTALLVCACFIANCALRVSGNRMSKSASGPSTRATRT